jgi:formylglycine-generating enzyme required for sulfatase activity
VCIYDQRLFTMIKRFYFMLFFIVFVSSCDGPQQSFSTPFVPKVTLSVDRTMLAEDASTVMVAATLDGVFTQVVEDASTVVVTATLDGVFTRTVVVSLEYGGEATRQLDYNSKSSIRIFAGDLSNSIELTAKQDTLDEVDESLTIDIRAVQNGKEDDTTEQQVSITLIDDDEPPVVTLNTSAQSLAESSGNIELTAALDTPSAKDVTVTLLYGGSAMPDRDYTVAKVIAGLDIESLENLTVDDILSASSGGLDALNGLDLGEAIDDLANGDRSISEATDGPLSALVIPAGSLSASLRFSSVSDVLDEMDETVTIGLVSIENGTAADAEQTLSATLLDDDDPPVVTVSLNKATLAEALGTVELTATLDAVSAKDISVTLLYTGDAITTTDYIVAESIALAAGSQSASITLTAVSDVLDEVDEVLTVNVIEATNARVDAGQQALTASIVDDDLPPEVSLSVDNASINEAAATAIVTVTLDAVSAKDVTINLAYSGTATSGGTDYSKSDSLVIAAGSTTGMVTLTATQDVLDENDETVMVDIDSVTHGTESGSQQVTTRITDDDAPPTVTLSRDNALIAEASGVSTLTATLNVVSGRDVTVSLSYGGTAVASTDYSKSDSLVITAGNLTETTTVTATSDDVDESDETVVVDIGSVTHGSESGTQQVSTSITDDDTAGITVSAIGGATSEAAVSATFTVVLDSEPTQDVTIGVSSSDTGEGTVNTATLTFTSGNWNSAQTVTVTGVNDDVDDGDQVYSVVLAVASSSDSNYNGLNPSDVSVSNSDNDAATLSINDISITELDAAGSATTTFTVSSSVESVNTITVDYASSDDTATAGSDYTATSGTVTMTAGATSQTFTITHLGDVIDEANETFNITLSNATNATISDNTGVATINDNDAEPTVAFSAATSTHNESTSAGSIAVSSSAVSGLNISVPFTLGGTAVASSQYSSLSSSPLTISAGSSSANITFTSIVDSNSSDETLIVTLGAPTYADLGATTIHTLTFNDQSVYTNPQGQTFNRIEAGTFTMGSPVSEANRGSDETEHSVTLSQSFYMQTTEVTQAQWLDAGYTNPSQENNGDNTYPVEMINWWEALHYANWLSGQNGLTACYVMTNCNGNAVGADKECDTAVTYQNDSGAVATPYQCEGYRLPTESEWEYAARAGTTTVYSFGASIDGNYVWYSGNASSTTHTVAGKTANPWGLYDMHGNVWEWVNDWYDATYPGTTTDPTGGSSGSARILRGGSWFHDEIQARSANRGRHPPGNQIAKNGFRLLLRSP